MSYGIIEVKVLTSTIVLTLYLLYIAPVEKEDYYGISLNAWTFYAESL
jgi:hypothetical protein